MTKTSSAKKAISIVTVLSILVCMFTMFAGVSANAATDKVSMYSTETYFCKYGMTEDCGLLVNSSRAIIYADQTENFATVAAAKAKEVAGQMEMFIHNI